MDTLILVIILGYFFPTIISLLRRHNVGGVLIINFLLGWSVIGWIISLIMACGSQSKTVIINNNSKKEKE
ncbi:superinfection immunity protein [Helicobacter cappadocius]|uniref:superinfection immunity protein n=1 Tax=Helicobacter cappadocius TaxID=3063998 RepID=UPI00351E9092